MVISINLSKFYSPEHMFPTRIYPVQHLMTVLKHKEFLDMSVNLT